MTQWFLDTEFDEDGKTIELISIGLCSDEGHSYYAVSREFDPLHCNDWVKQNVLNQLPPAGDPLWKTRAQIRDDIVALVKGGGGTPVFYAYYADYDWVALCQLFGLMIDLPPDFPKYCRDLKQMLDDYDNLRKTDLPEFEGQEHHALDDARWCRSGVLWIQRWCNR
jgi:hypothetical protein